MSSWHNVSKRELCPICHKPDWCNLSNDGVVAICHRVESPYPARGGGWIHRLREVVVDSCSRRKDDNLHSTTTTQNYTLSFARIHAGYDADSSRLQALASTLGVKAESLKALEVRYNLIDDCWSFPMRDSEGQIVGLRFRACESSAKWSARGSRDGLFVGNRYGRDLVIVEGASDTAAALSLGLWAVGRSSCQTGAGLLRQYIRKHRPLAVTIVADNDAPGIRGAEALAEQLAGNAVRVLVVPYPYKDLRAWYNSGLLTPKVFNDLVSAQNFTS